MSSATNFFTKNSNFHLVIAKFDFILTYQFLAFAMETWNAKHQSERLNIFFCWNETNIKSVKDPTTQEVTNHRWK